MTPRLSGHFPIFGLVFFVLKSLLGIARQWSRKKNWKPQSHVRSLIYRSGAISHRVCSHNPSLPALFPVARDHWKAETKLVPIIPLSRFSLALGAREFHNPHLVLGKPVEEAPSLDSHYDFSLVTGTPLLKSVPPAAWEGRALITCTSQWYRD